MCAIVRLRAARWVDVRGTLRPCIGHHKNIEFELGGHRYVVSACNSDRPAFIIKLKSEELADMELLHFYNAMGLAKQKEDQQALLARVADFELAQAVIQAATELLGITTRAAHSTHITTPKWGVNPGAGGVDGAAM